MARGRPSFACQQCGATSPRWSGRCDACGAWNSLAEEAAGGSPPKGLGPAKGHAIEIVPLAGENRPEPRRATGIAEFDRVLGGGLVAGSAVLIGGDPGIGKSTLLLQVAATVAGSGVETLYVSGEEAIEQLRMRARRLGLAEAAVGLAAATSVRDILTSIDRRGGPNAVIIDSIQTLYLDTLDSAPGTVGQVRAAAQELIRAAKRRGFALLLVGHVTKEGLIAGPRVLEHMVDTVVYFEGERGHQFRILRAVKNRFGPTDEIGVFEMTNLGLQQVANPSSLFLGAGGEPASGTAVFAGIEGTRPLLVEIQALVAPSSLGAPRRAVVGWDTSRLAMTLAVLEARCGLSFAGEDVYLNVAGGFRIAEPAADLAVAAALVSARAEMPVAGRPVWFGEIGLSGEVRAVSQPDLRLKEAAKLGFKTAIMPPTGPRRGGGAERPERVVEISHLTELVHMFADAPALKPRGRRAHQGPVA
jgi:DNA repair protein RadA/Sms